MRTSIDLNNDDDDGDDDVWKCLIHCNHCMSAGYAYIIDNDAGSCQVHLTSEGQFAFVDETGSGTKVRQQTPAEFFLATNVTWEYGGVVS